MFEQENNFKTNVLFRLMDLVLLNLSTLYGQVTVILNRFSFIWKYSELNEEILTKQVETFVKEFSVDVLEELLSKMKNI